MLYFCIKISAALTSYLQFSTVAYLLFGKRSYRISDNRVGSIVRPNSLSFKASRSSGRFSFSSHRSYGVICGLYTELNGEI